MSSILLRGGGKKKTQQRGISLPKFSHNCVVRNLEPDILECEVKQALASIVMNEAGGGDGIPTELFQILKDNAVKVLHSICNK